MAEEIIKENDSDSPSVLKKYGPLAAIVLVAQVVLAWVLIEYVFTGRPDTEGEAELFPDERIVVAAKTERAATRLPYYYKSAELKNIVSNPAGTNAQRIVMASIQLGLVGYDRSKKPPKDDITNKLGEDMQLLQKIDQNAAKMKSIVVKVLRTKTVDQLDGERLTQVEEEIRRRLNDEIFKRIFDVDEKNTREISVQEVDFSDIVIQ